MNINDNTIRENFRNKVRMLCDTLDFYDNLKEEILKTNIDLKYVLGLDNEIRKIEHELADISFNMVNVDTCNCDGVNSCCSSPLCPSQYNNYK